MNELNEILLSIEQTANTHLSGDVLTGINSNIQYCRSKMGDDKLYLALVGEFSSGKSTFINALLGFRLLKEAVMPTTACATYIQSKGRSLSIDATFFDGKQFNATPRKFSEIAAYLKSKYKKTYTTQLEIIEAITSDQEIAKTVKHLNIYVPNANIPSNVVLIDTPGFNPGASSVDNHYEITKHVVENIADAALILTPQEQAMSATLSRFLNDTLHRCLHRCYFVITKMDNSDPDHRSEIINFVRQRITTDLNISKPKLYAESAITMLPVKKIPSSKADDWKYYSLSFKQFETALWKNIKKSKDIVLKEHIDNLVQEIVQECSQNIKERELSIKEEREFLAAHKIEKIQNVCNTMVSQSADAINSVLDRIIISFDKAEYNSKSRSEQIINSGSMSMAAFRSNMLPAIRNAVEEEAHKELAIIDSTINRRVKQCVDTQILKMQNVFASHYNNFPTLRPKNSTLTTNLIKFNMPNMLFAIAVSKIKELDEKESQTTKWAGAGGAGIGFLLGGPIGALIGGAIGAIGGAVAGDQSDQMRASAKPLVVNEIVSYFISLREMVENEKNAIKSRYLNLINKFAKEHISNYGSAVENLIREHKNQIDTLDKQIKQLKIALSALISIQEQLEEELALLKLKN